MGECAAAVAVADGEDAGGGGLKVLVDRNIAVLIRRDGSGGEIEVAGVGRATHGKQNVGGDDARLALVALESDSDL